MFYQLIAHLDKKLNFATVSAYSDSVEKNDLLTKQFEQTQPGNYSSWLADSLNLAENNGDGGRF